MTTDQQTRATVWPDQIYEVLKDAGVSQVAYVPDAGHAKLINRCHADKAMHAVSLTTEEEGIAMLAGAWMGGAKGVLLMQSSGVGNCINMLSLYEECRLPLLMIVTMRGVWGEFNPWQVAMGGSTAAALENAGVIVHSVDRAKVWPRESPIWALHAKLARWGHNLTKLHSIRPWPCNLLTWHASKQHRLPTSKLVCKALSCALVAHSS